MSQESIYTYLKCKDWRTTKQIKKDLNLSQSTITRALRILYKWDYITKKEVTGRGGLQHYYKRI